MQLTTENLQYIVQDRTIFYTDKERWVLPSKSKLLLFGANGAGKTTFLECISSTKKHRNTRILINQQPVRQDEVAYMKQIPDMKSTGTIRNFIKDSFSIKGIRFNKEIWSMIKLFGLNDEHFYEDMSFGQRRVLSFICAYCQHAVLMCIDELSMGVHWPHVKVMLDMLKDYNNMVVATSNDNQLPLESFSHVSWITKEKVLTYPQEISKELDKEIHRV